ncbi:MAG: hypothetical protein ACE14M_02600 [Terriglobales bacterium]
MTHEEKVIYVGMLLRYLLLVIVFVLVMATYTYPGSPVLAGS